MGISKKSAIVSSVVRAGQDANTTNKSNGAKSVLLKIFASMIKTNICAKNVLMHRVSVPTEDKNNDAKNVLARRTVVMVFFGTFVRTVPG